MAFAAIGVCAVCSVLAPPITAALGEVGSHQKISDTAGDLDGDGVGDLAVGAVRDDDGGGDRGAVWLLFLDLCGNGIVDSGEQCDDGNNTDGDSCSGRGAHISDGRLSVLVRSLHIPPGQQHHTCASELDHVQMSQTLRRVGGNLAGVDPGSVQTPQLDQRADGAFHANHAVAAADLIVVQRKIRVVVSADHRLGLNDPGNGIALGSVDDCEHVDVGRRERRLAGGFFDGFRVDHDKTQFGDGSVPGQVTPRVSGRRPIHRSAA